jgi:hypothetical protein
MLMLKITKVFITFLKSDRTFIVLEDLIFIQL